MAYEHNIRTVPHGWNTAIGLAADLHLTAALPVADYVEFLTPSPYMDRLITNPLKPDADGILHLPDGPGLGIELNEEVIREHLTPGDPAGYFEASTYWDTDRSWDRSWS